MFEKNNMNRAIRGNNPWHYAVSQLRFRNFRKIKVLSNDHEPQKRSESMTKIKSDPITLRLKSLLTNIITVLNYQSNN